MEFSSFKQSQRGVVKAVYATKYELTHFLRLLDTSPNIQKLFKYDKSYHLADKYLIAMVFIYFKRAELDIEDYTSLNFFAGLCLAHSMEEDIELTSEIYPWALGSDLKDYLPKLLELKILLWEAMDYRAAVSKHCCQQLINISLDHPVWKRERISQYFITLPAPNINYIAQSRKYCNRKIHNRSKSNCRISDLDTYKLNQSNFMKRAKFMAEV